MAASARSNQEGASGQKLSTSAAANGSAENSANSGGNSTSSKRNSAAPEAAQSLRHDPGLSTDWTSEEQAILEDLLIKYASCSSIVRYAKIAMELKDKTLRDVAMRCRWLTKKESGKRRKEDHSARKSKERKEKPTETLGKPSSLLTPRLPYHQPILPVDTDDGIPFEAIGGVTGDLLKQNSHFLSQISANFSTYQFHDNINLLSKTRDNILTVLHDASSVSDMPEIMKQMPPLPVKLNQELANSILPYQIK